jgi:hypothetical protein
LAKGTASLLAIKIFTLQFSTARGEFFWGQFSAGVVEFNRYSPHNAIRLTLLYVAGTPAWDTSQRHPAVHKAKSQMTLRLEAAKRVHLAGLAAPLASDAADSLDKLFRRGCDQWGASSSNG